MFIRDDPDEAIALTERILAHHGVSGIYPPLMGSPDEIVERLKPIAALGFHHMYFDALSPYDEESLERMVTEVRPRLQETLVAEARVLEPAVD
jgi:alkanesulfonate monooxygenase SsuD/methylene tetrahydromethanopterin reductase-like flavin-dependent oxidoreductase (luciferase family)